MTTSTTTSTPSNDTSNAILAPISVASDMTMAQTNVTVSLFNEQLSWNLQLVGSKTAEYLEVSRICLEYQVEAVYAVQNEMIEQRYTDAVAVTLEKGTFKAFHTVWHIVHTDDEIIGTGFTFDRIDMEQKHGAAFGVGLYVTTSQEIAATYSIKNNRNEVFRMVLCELCETADTIGKSGGTAFVQPNKRLVRPRYVVHFRNPRFHPGSIRCLTESGDTLTSLMPPQAPFQMHHAKSILMKTSLYLRKLLFLQLWNIEWLRPRQMKN